MLPAGLKLPARGKDRPGAQPYKISVLVILEPEVPRAPVRRADGGVHANGDSRTQQGAPRLLPPARRREIPDQCMEGASDVAGNRVRPGRLAASRGPAFRSRGERGREGRHGALQGRYSW